MTPEALRRAFPGVLFEHHAEIGSTNDRAKALAAGETPPFSVIYADAQTAGRGRFARAFYSPAGSGLYLSLLLRPTAFPASEAARLTGYTAVALCEALDELCPGIGKELKLKWVNDIYLRERKLCGILTEGRIAPDGSLDYAVVGIGLNLSTEFPKELREIATSLAIEGFAPPAPEAIIAALLPRIATYERDLVAPCPAYLEKYRARLLYKNEEIAVLEGSGEQTLRGMLRGLDDTGALLLETEGGIVTVAAGEISIRRT